MNTIDHLSFTKTTAEVIDWFRKTGLDIHEDMKTCSLGNRLAIESVLGKQVVEHTYLEREELIYKDVLESE